MVGLSDRGRFWPLGCKNMRNRQVWGSHDMAWCSNGLVIKINLHTFQTWCIASVKACLEAV